MMTKLYPKNMRNTYKYRIKLSFPCFRKADIPIFTSVTRIYVNARQSITLSANSVYAIHFSDTLRINLTILSSLSVVTLIENKLSTNIRAKLCSELYIFFSVQCRAVGRDE